LLLRACAAGPSFSRAALTALLGTMADDPVAEKARELVAKAQKKLGSWFASFSGSKYEEAEELYKKAANQFKVAKSWDEAGEAFERAAECALKQQSPHDTATSYMEAANCYKKTNATKSLRCFREVVSLHIDLGRFTQAAKVQKEIGELLEAEGDAAAACDEYQKSVDYYEAEDSNSQASQVLLKIAGLSTTTKDYERAISIYERVAIASLENNLLRFSVKGYLLNAGICRMAAGDPGKSRSDLERYEGMDASFTTTREGQFLRALVEAFEALDEDTFTEVIRGFDEVSRLDAQKTTLLLEVKNKIKQQEEDIT